MSPNTKSNKILIVGPAWVGDMVITQTLFKVLKQQHSSVIIDVLAPNWSFPLLERMPEVHQAWEMPIGHGKIALGKRYRIAKKVTKQKYDQSILIPNSFKSALIPWLAGIPIRTGWRGEYRWGLVNDIRILDPKALPLMIQRCAALGIAKFETLADKLPRPKLEVDSKHATQALEKFGLNLTRPILALCPGAEFGPAKRWPEEHYANVARVKLDEGWNVWIFGSAKDYPVAEKIQGLTTERCTNLCGKTSLAEAIDLMSFTTQVVSNDSGLMHIASALQKSLVAVYGSTDPGFTPPLAVEVKTLSSNISCSPCFKRECPLGHLKCLKELDPQRVIQALNELA